jgi:hypothetical protein
MSLVITSPDGQPVMQQDLELSEVMMTQWQTGEFYLDERWLSIPCGLPAGEYEMRISLYHYDYDTSTISGLPARNASGEKAELVTLTRIAIAHARASQCGT